MPCSSRQHETSFTQKIKFHYVAQKMYPAELGPELQKLYIPRKTSLLHVSLCSNTYRKPTLEVNHCSCNVSISPSNKPFKNVVQKIRIRVTNKNYTADMVMMHATIQFRMFLPRT
jgi:hypothetical protein